MCGDGCCTIPMGHGHPHGHFRKFFTKDEKIKQLEEYVRDLKTEIKAVEEIISEMK